jgi:hypothetical protein
MLLYAKIMNTTDISCLEESMASLKYVYWEDANMWLGYLEEFPDYMTQGESLEELRENLRDIYKDLSSGEIPGVRRVAELQIP